MEEESQWSWENQQRVDEWKQFVHFPTWKERIKVFDVKEFFVRKNKCLRRPIRMD